MYKRATGCISCSVCGKEFDRDMRDIRKTAIVGGKIYCSSECHAIAQRTGKIVQCSECGKEVYKTVSNIRDSNNGSMFCGKSCAASYHNRSRVGVDHPSYTNGCGSYRRLAISELGSKCRICGYDIMIVLQVHHKDRNRGNNSIDNLDVLCPTHHNEYHKGVRKY
jgi:hypothetical protein